VDFRRLLKLKCPREGRKKREQEEQNEKEGRRDQDPPPTKFYDRSPPLMVMGDIVYGKYAPQRALKYAVSSQNDKIYTSQYLRSY